MKVEADAALAAMRAAWKPLQVHEVGKVPASPVTPYAVVGMSSAAATNLKLCANHGSRSYRISVQTFGVSATEVAHPVEAAEVAFMDKRLTITGFDTTPCVAEISTPIIRDPDAGVLLGCFLTFTFISYPN